ncbi:dual 3',5'-cyclic-AMP and -GMP phosphodiesterase 11, partial [Caerostris extrusa]
CYSVLKAQQELRAFERARFHLRTGQDIYNDVDAHSFCHKILQIISVLTKADRCSLFLVKGDKGDLSRCLVSQLLDVSCSSTIEQMRRREEIRIPWGTGIVGHVAESGESLNIPDCYKDARFNSQVDRTTGYKTHNMLCMPICDANGEVKAVAQTINKCRGEKPFTYADEERSILPHYICTLVKDFCRQLGEIDVEAIVYFSRYLQFCSIGLRNAELYEKSDLENKRNQVLLELTRLIFEEQSTIGQIVHRIMIYMQSFIQFEKMPSPTIG